MDMCRFGMIAVDDGGVRRPVQKCTKLIINSPEVALRVYKQCPNRDKSKPCAHRKHCRLECGKRYKQAQVYPSSLCQAICEGISAQKKHDGMNLSALEPMCVRERLDFGLGDLHDIDNDDYNWIASDDVAGEALDAKMVQAARREEIQHFTDMKVYKYARIRDCLNATSRRPIGVRWMDVNKGDSIKPNNRSRLVAKEYKVEARPELLVATPPTDCMRLLASRVAENKSNKMLYIDITRAYFHARSTRSGQPIAQEGIHILL